MVTAEEYKQAEHDLMLVEARRGWQVHALVYALVNTGLIILNTLLVVFTDANFFWFPFVLVCWGIGLTMHYFFGFRHAEEQIEHRQEKIEARAQRLHLAT
jgi:2TM domain